MDCRRLIFSGHAVRRMFERQISRDDVAYVIHNGEIIKDYPEDAPFPSRLMLGYVSKRAIHVVVGTDTLTEVCYVITAYDPDPAIWESDFKRRRTT